jgi:hypothetical protein
MLKNSIRRGIIGLVIIMSSLAVVSPGVSAAEMNGCAKSFFGIPVWYQYLGTDNGKDCNVNTDQKNVPALVVLGFIDIALYLAGILAVLMIIWGGYKFILSDGSPDQIAGGRKTILNAVIGLLIAIFSAQIVRFVASKLSGN